MSGIKKFLSYFLKKDKIQAEDDWDYYEGDGIRRTEDEVKDFKVYHKYPFVIRLYYYIFTANIFVGMIRFLLALMKLNPGILPSSVAATSFWIISAIAVWIWSTAFEYWNFHKRKRMSLTLVIVGTLCLLSLQLVRVSFYPVLRVLGYIPINREITGGMIVLLTRGILLLISVLFPIIVGSFLFSTMYSQDSMEQILSFKITRGIDLRKNKEFKYDFRAVLRMSDGKPQVVYEQDRQLHMVVSGATGTAKTSSVLVPSIASDLDQKRKNENYQKQECVKAVENGEFRIVESFSDMEFSINYFEPVEGSPEETKKRKEKYEFLKFVSSSAGVTVVAPNEGLADDAYNLAVNRGFRVNRIDPILVNGEQKEGFVGINPLYISKGIQGVDRDVTITNNAGVFADVLKALYDMSGSTDAYFASVNNSITIAVSKLLMLTFEDLHGRQPNPADVQLCINDFHLCEPYLEKLVEKYDQNKVGRGETEDAFSVNRGRNENVNCGIWQDVYTLIKNDLLSENMGEKMYDRANGLRLQINGFMNHPLVRRVLCAEKSIDIDKALANGEITVVNYSLELGQSVSTAFGLFFLLTFSKAVLRRPGTERTRVIHFDYIDEFPVLLHPYLEEYFSLHRQYRVANTVALQTYDQMDKNRSTQFLKSVLLGVGHQVLFGRLSTGEMEMFRIMSGKVTKDEEQRTETETSITSDRPMHTFSKRRAVKEVDHISPTALRYRDFQEVTFFTTQQGTPLRGMHGKVNFLKPSMKKGLPAVRVDWSRFIDDTFESKNTWENGEVFVHRASVAGEFSFASGFSDEDDELTFGSGYKKGET